MWFLIAFRVKKKCDAFIVLDWFLVQSMTLIHGFGVPSMK